MGFARRVLLHVLVIASCCLPGATTRAKDVGISSMPALSIEERDALVGAGYRTSVDLRRLVSPMNTKKRKGLAKKLGMEPARLDQIVGRAEVMQWEAVSPDLAVHMATCGAGSWEALRLVQAPVLRACLVRLITGVEGSAAMEPDAAEPEVLGVPSTEELSSFIEEAHRMEFKVVKSAVERTLPLELIPGLSARALQAAKKKKWTTNLAVAKGLASGTLRAKFQKKYKLEDEELRVLYGMVSLTRMDDMPPDLALLLVRAGISSLGRLNGANVKALRVDLQRANEKNQLLAEVPSEEELQKLTARAGDYPVGQ